MRGDPVIKQSDCKFYINEDKRTIVCVIPNTKDCFLDFVYERTDWLGFSIEFYGEARAKLKMSDSYVGKAVCAAEDEWDEETGKLLAYTRARTKFYRSFYKRGNYYINYIDNKLGEVVEAFNNLGDKVTVWQANLQEKLSEKIKGED